MNIVDCEQRSPEWHAARAACLMTASDAGQFVFGTDRKSASARRSRILRYLRGQMDIPADAWEIQKRDDEERRLKFNTAIARGNALEDEARDLFAELRGLHISQPGMVLSECGMFGASPDGLIHAGGPATDPVAGLEIKCPELETYLGWILDGGLPPEHADQVHASMAITGLRCWWFLGYYRGAPPLMIRVEWDHYTERLRSGFAGFRAEMQAALEGIRGTWAILAEQAEREGVADE